MNVDRDFKEIESYIFSDKENNCKLCSQFISNDPGNLFNKILKDEKEHVIADFPHFIWGVGLGQVIEGYTLLIPKRHVLSFSMLNKEELKECSDIIQYIIEQTDGIFKSKPIFFEHGCNDDFSGKGGSCIDHAHLHIFPKNLNLKVHFDQVLQPLELASVTELKKMQNQCQPYIFYFNANTNQNLVYPNAYNIPSQLGRMIVQKAANSSFSWDWKKFIGLEEMRNTIALYKKI